MGVGGGVDQSITPSQRYQLGIGTKIYYIYCVYIIKCMINKHVSTKSYLSVIGLLTYYMNLKYSFDFLSNCI